MDVNGIIANLFSTFSVCVISYHGYLPSQVDFFVSGSGLPNSDFRSLFENMEKDALGVPCGRHWKCWCVQRKKGKVEFGIHGEREKGREGLALVGVGRACAWELGVELSCTVAENLVIASLNKLMRITQTGYNNVLLKPGSSWFIISGTELWHFSSSFLFFHSFCVSSSYSKVVSAFVSLLPALLPAITAYSLLASIFSNGILLRPTLHFYCDPCFH